MPKKAKEYASNWLKKNRSLVLRQTPVWAQSFTIIVVTLGVGTITAASLFKIDEVVTVVGELEPVKGSIGVKTPVGGKITEVYFKDGEKITEGQTLVKFDTRQAAAEKKTLTRLINLERKDLNEKLSILNQKKSSLKNKLDTSKIVAESLENLVKIGGYQRMQYLQQLDEVYELKTRIASIDMEIRRTRLETEKSLGQMENRLKQAELQLVYQQVKSPTDGIIFEPKVRIGSVFQAGEEIVTVVPQSGLKAEVFVPNKDIGFVKRGQVAKVRVDSFPSSRYGELNGTVSQIGQIVVTDSTYNYYRFPVRLKLEKPYLETKGVRIPLRSGMSVTANLKLREKRVISLISDMFVDQTESIKSIRQQ